MLVSEGESAVDSELITLLNALYQVGIRTISEDELCSSLDLSCTELHPRLLALCLKDYLVCMKGETAHYCLTVKCADYEPLVTLRDEDFPLRRPEGAGLKG